jgi:hypothetical protein
MLWPISDFGILLANLWVLDSEVIIVQFLVANQFTLTLIGTETSQKPFLTLIGNHCFFATILCYRSTALLWQYL